MLRESFRYPKEYGCQPPVDSRFVDYCRFDLDAVLKSNNSLDAVLKFKQNQLIDSSNSHHLRGQKIGFKAALRLYLDCGYSNTECIEKNCIALKSQPRLVYQLYRTIAPANTTVSDPVRYRGQERLRERHHLPRRSDHIRTRRDDLTKTYTRCSIFRTHLEDIVRLEMHGCCAVRKANLSLPWSVKKQFTNPNSQRKPLCSKTSSRRIAAF